MDLPLILSSPIFHLASALAIGLLIGLERGWRERGAADGERIAGFRTHGLIGLLGGIAALVDPGSGIIVAAGLLSVALLLRPAFKEQIEETRSVGATSMIAALAAFGLGAVAGFGDVALAAAGGVLAVLILWLREPLHDLLRRIEAAELGAFLRLLLLTLVVLPVLPDQPMGPYGAFNPRLFWWMVILISALGFAGYVCVRTFGERHGTRVFGLFGGLVSSTATTASFARLARSAPDSTRSLSGAMMISWMVMIVRTAVLAGIFSPAVLFQLAGPLTSMLVTAGLFAVLSNNERSVPGTEMKLENPLELGSALLFACVLVVALFLSKVAAEEVGAVGVYGVAFLAGAADIDVVTLSISSVLESGISVKSAALAVVIAACANTVLKAGIASYGGGAFRSYALAAAGTMIAAALSVSALQAGILAP